MFDATKLLGSFLEKRSPGSMPQRLDSAMQGGQGGMLQQVLSQFGGGGSGGGGLGGGLGALLSRFTGGAGGGLTGSGGTGGGLLGQIGEMARRAAESPGAELRQNNPAAIGGAGALAGALMGGGRGAMGGGLLAVLGSLAYTAFQNQNAAPGAAAPVPAKAAELPGYARPEDVQRKASLVLRAMIQATKADGHLDDTESERLTRHIAEAGDDPEAKQFLQAELARPVDIAGLAAEVRTPEEAAEIYAASIMAITVDTPAERSYLTDLAAALRLPPGVVSQVNASLNVKA